tara:strand:+ start:1115 stop:2104 length:990 start_codon:yes stop_codon:yes gene_type:complete
MAINPNLIAQYAKSYGGSDQARFGEQVGSALASLVPNKDDKLKRLWAGTFEDIFGQYAEENIESMGDVDALSADDAYLKWSQSLSPRMRRHAEKRGLLNPALFRAEYDKYKSALALDLNSKLDIYKKFYKKSDREMSSLLDNKPNLRKLLISKVPMQDEQGMPNPTINYLIPRDTLGESWGRTFKGIGEGIRGMVEPENIGGTALKAGLGYGAYRGLKSIDALGKAKKFFTGKEAKKQTASSLMNKSKAAGQAVSGLYNTVLSKIEKHGAARVSAYVAKNLGWKVAARTLAKIGLGAAGLATGGALTAAMAAWSAKDLHDVAKTIQEMK